MFSLVQGDGQKPITTRFEKIIEYVHSFVFLHGTQDKHHIDVLSTHIKDFESFCMYTILRFV